jgi:hypothetical protein
LIARILGREKESSYLLWVLAVYRGRKAHRVFKAQQERMEWMVRTERKEYRGVLILRI